MWDVRGTHRSFGQLLLLGRAAQCVHQLECAIELRGPIDGEALRDLEAGMALMATLCRQNPAIVADLMSLSVRVRGVKIGMIPGWCRVFSDTQVDLPGSGAALDPLQGSMVCVESK